LSTFTISPDSTVVPVNGVLLVGRLGDRYTAEFGVSSPHAVTVTAAASSSAAARQRRADLSTSCDSPEFF
jgi:hypothetical protein